MSETPTYDTGTYDGYDDGYDDGGRYLPDLDVVDGELVEDELEPWDEDIVDGEVIEDGAIEPWEPGPLVLPGPATSDSAPASHGGGPATRAGWPGDGTGRGRKPVRRRGGITVFGDEDLDVDEADEVILDLLDTIENAEELDRDQIHNLGLLLGDKRAAIALGRALNEEAKQARAGRKRRGWWHWWFGPGHEQGDPIPDGLAALLLRIAEGRPLDWSDFKRLGQVVGRRSVRLLEGLIHGAVVRDQDQTRGRGGRR